MGADIEGEAGVGYVLGPGFLLPPLMFSEEEIQALMLGAQWVHGQTDESLALAAQNALAKIGAVLPDELQRKLDDTPFYVEPRQQASPSIDLATLRIAAREQRKVLVSYRDLHDVVTERIIWPISLGFIETKRYVAAWCELRQDFRTFRVDRIQQAKNLVDTYPGRRRDLLIKWRAIADGADANS